MLTLMDNSGTQIRKAVEPRAYPAGQVRIGLALGGGFARGIAHAGVLKVIEQSGLRLHCIAGVSAGSIAAAAFASGASAKEIGQAGASMRFSDVARWSPNRMGFMGSDRMEGFVRKLLKSYRFEDMKIPLGVVATDLATGRPAAFRDHGDVCLPLRASCSYPGIFQPVQVGGRLLVDGGVSMEIPAVMCRQMGATHVISVNLPSQPHTGTRHIFDVVARCLQLIQARNAGNWRRESDAVAEVDSRTAQWYRFANGEELIAAGERSAQGVMPLVRSWLNEPARRVV